MRTFTEEAPYGAWIKPNGEIIAVIELCGHRAMCEYGDADEDGWVCVVYPRGKDSDLCFRFNPENVTKAALNSGTRMIRTSGVDSFHFEDIWTDTIYTAPFTNHYKVKTRTEALQFILGIKNGALVPCTYDEMLANKTPKG